MPEGQAMLSGNRLRLAIPDDAKQIFRWRNDPWIVSLATSRKTVTWEEHLPWFSSVLDRTQHLLFIIVSDGDDAGIVRLDKTGGETATVTIYLLREFTGRGIGPHALAVACQTGFQHWPSLQTIAANIRQDNIPSIRAFERAGFFSSNETDPGQPDHVQLVRRRDNSKRQPN